MYHVNEKVLRTGLTALILLLPLPVSGQEGSTVTGISRTFNPAISLNGLFLAALFDGEPPGHDDEAGTVVGEHGEHAHSEVTEGLQMQGVEIRLTSFVDPLLKGDITIGIHGESVEIEEAFVTSQSLPAGLTLKIGKGFSPFGKHNRLHPHQYPFVEAPLIHTALLGEEGLREFGGELSWLLPLPFFLEATAAVYNGDNGFFESDHQRDLMGLGRMNTLLDLSESTTLEVGASHAVGRSHWSGSIETVSGADLTFKWRPLQRALYTQAEWQLEYLTGSRLPEEDAASRFGGLTSHLRYRFNRTLWLGARYELTGLPGEAEEAFTRYSVNLAWVPGEFELWRLQYSRTIPDAAVDPDFGALYLQMTFTIGSHPAHTY